MAFSAETKVGILVVAAAVGLSWLSFKSGYDIGPFSQQEQFRQLESTFADVEGITVGSKIKMAGVDVGEVTDIQLSPSGLATLKLAVDPEVPVPANVQAQIASSGLIGEKFIALITDYGAEGVLDPAIQSIPSAGEVSAANMADNFAKVSDDLEEITKALRAALGGPDNAGKLQQIVDGLSEFSASLQTEGTSLITDAREALTSLNNILSKNEGAASDMIQDFSVTAENLAKITTRLENGEGMLGQMMQGNGEDGELNNLMTDLQQAAAEFRQVMGKINQGEGSLGKLVNDTETVDKVEEALETFTEYGQRMEAFRTEVAFEGLALTSEEVTKGRFGLTLSPRPGRFYVLGVTSDGFVSEEERFDGNPSFRGEDFGNKTKFTVQFGHVFQQVPVLNQDVALRLGMKDSTFGIGADLNNIELPWRDRYLSLSADLYDFGADNSGRSSEENPHLDLTARFNLLGTDHLYSMVGYDNVLSETYGSPFFGIGIKFQDDDLKYALSGAL